MMLRTLRKIVLQSWYFWLIAHLTKGDRYISGGGGLGGGRGGGRGRACTDNNIGPKDSIIPAKCAPNVTAYLFLNLRAIYDLYKYFFVLQ